MKQARASDSGSAAERAFQMAQCLPAAEGPVTRVAVADEHGELIAWYALGGDQLLLFREQLAAIGFADRGDRFAAEQWNCDLVLQRLVAAPPAELLVTASERWPDSLSPGMGDDFPPGWPSTSAPQR